MSDQRPLDFAPSPRPPGEERRISIPKLTRRQWITGAVVAALGAALGRMSGSASGVRDPNLPNPEVKPASSPGRTLAAAIATELALPPTPVIFPTETRLPTRTPDMSTPTPVPTRTPERFVPRSSDVGRNFIPGMLEEKIQKEKLTVQNLGTMMRYQNFNLTEQERQRVTPKIRQVTTPNGGIIEITISQEFLIKAGVLSDLYVALHKGSSSYAGNVIRLSASQLAAVYNDQNKIKDSGEVSFYIDEGGLGDEKYIFGEQKQLMDNVIVVEPGYRSTDEYEMSFLFADGSTDIAKNSAGQMEVRPKLGRPYIDLSFSR
jgi:hypothetical protein